MNWFKSIKSNPIIFLIWFVLVFLAANGALDYYYRGVVAKHEQLVTKKEKAKELIDRLMTGINLLDIGFRGFYIVPKDNLLFPHMAGVGLIEQTLKDVAVFLQAEDINPKEVNYVATKASFEEYIDLLDMMIEWRKEGRMPEIDSVVTLDPGLRVLEQYRKLEGPLKNKYDTIVKESEAKTAKVVFISSIVRASLLLFGIPTLFIVAFRLNREKKRRIKLFADLDTNNKKYLFNPNDNEDGALDENTIINSLIINLKKASDFISKIAKGDYGVKWDGLNEQNKEVNKENLVGELLKMRDQMIVVKEEDTIRLWVTEGISKFAEIVRQYQNDLKILSDQLTSNVANYLHANQVFLYLVVDKNDTQVLELFGCYAYNRKKFMEKVIEPGQGLVGQAYLEKSTTQITSLPKDYVKITSGLGEAVPTNLLIVPLRFNETVEGVLEIASFTPFKKHEVEFLDRVGEIIASAIINERSSSKMKRLMETMQVQSEEMKAQEEEMRQNMEELQATQEEMSRKANEYQALIVEKEEIINQLRRAERITS